MDTKPISEMTAAERVARIAEMEALKPLASEPEIVPLCAPAVICFAGNGHYATVCNEPAALWPGMEHIFECLLGMLPYRHRLDYLRERIEKGATMGLAFSDTEQNFIREAGFIGPEIDDDGRLVVFAAVCTFRDLDIEHVARIGESIALKTGAAGVRIWTPAKMRLIPGYQPESAFAGQLQYAAVRPIQ
jgi:hypothetical protein